MVRIMRPYRIRNGEMRQRTILDTRGAGFLSVFV